LSEMLHVTLAETSNTEVSNERGVRRRVVVVASAQRD
jgi:hypothetical protein